MARKHVVLHIIKSLGRGGAEMLLPATLKEHDRSAFDFHYIYFLPWKDQLVPALEQAGGRVTCLSAANNVAMLFRLVRLIRYIKENEIQLLHCHLPWAGIVGRLAGWWLNIPVLYTEHNKQERYHFLTRWLNRITLPLSHRVIAVSEEVARSILAVKGSSFAVDVIKNGVDIDLFSGLDRGSARDALRIPDTSLVVGNVCVFRKQKRLLVWLSLAEQVHREYPEVIFLLVGAGPLAPEVAAHIQANHMQPYVICPGLQTDVRPFLACMDIFMITSEFEGLPVAMLEAMAAGIPVVSTQAGGIGEVVGDGREGFVVPVETPESLLMPLQRLIQDESLRNKLGRNAYQRVQSAFSLQRMTQQLEALYRAALGQ